MRIIIDQEEIQDTMTVDQFIGMQEGKMAAAKAVMAHFVYADDGRRLTDEEGAAWIGKLSIRKLTEAANEFTQKVQEIIVPNPSGKAST